MLDVPDREEDFAADPVELFFDLAFVFGFSQLVGRLVEDPTPSGVATTALLFMMMWLPWTQFAWSANAVPGNSRGVRIIMLMATVASVPMAASVSTALEAGGPTFGISMVVILAMGIALLVAAFGRQSAEFSSAVKYSIPNIVAMVLVVGGAFLGGSARVLAWVLALSSVVFGTLRAGSGTWVMRPGHFAERHGLIVIVALGEVIVAIAGPVVRGLEGNEGLSAATIVSLSAAGAFAGLLWWGYFDRPRVGFEYQAERIAAGDRGRYARDVYTYLHAPIAAGVIVAAAALEEITLHPTEVLPMEFRWMMVIGLAMFLGGIDGAVYRAFKRVPPERAVAALVVAALALLGGSVPGLTLLIAVDAVLFVMLVVEHRRIERLRAGKLAAARE